VLNTPLSVTDTTASHRVPFAKMLCASNIDTCLTTVVNGTTPTLPQTFVAPATTASGDAVKELVVEFVSGSCSGSARTAGVFIEANPGTLQVANTGDSFSVNVIPMAVAQFNDVPGGNGVQAFAQQTQITYAPGTTIGVTFDFAKAGGLRCLVQLNGHYNTR
jgi:hypothetical protein